MKEIYLKPKPVNDLKIPFVFKVAVVDHSHEMLMAERLNDINEKYMDVPLLDYEYFVSKTLMEHRKKCREARGEKPINLEVTCWVCFVYPRGEEYTEEYMEQLVEEKIKEKS